MSSISRRDDVTKLVEAGLSYAEIGRRLGITREGIIRAIALAPAGIEDSGEKTFFAFWISSRRAPSTGPIDKGTCRTTPIL